MAPVKESLKERLLKNSTIKATSIMSESSIFKNNELIKTSVPMLNVGLSGSVDGGLGHGLLVLAGPSKHFKSSFALILAEAFYKKNEKKDPIILFYDSEFGSPLEYFAKHGVPTENVVHTPITNVEELKHDLMTQLDSLKEDDCVMIVVDSMGNLASKKEVDDAIDGKVVTDMTRAKAFKSLFRMITPHLTLKKIPMVVINHTYDTMEMYSTQVVSGGKGVYYSANAIWILGRRQNRAADKELLGYDFVINIEKSRLVKEKSSIPITVSFDAGIKKWSGMFDLAEDMGYIAKVGATQKYQALDPVTGELIGQEFKTKDLIEEFEDVLYNEILDRGMRQKIEDKFKLV